MAQTVTIRYFGMYGTGRNVTEAKRDAGEKIEVAFRGTYNPIMLPLSDGTIMIGYRQPDNGWSYWFWRNGSLSGGSFSPGDTREACEQRMRNHAAQYTDDPSFLNHPTCTAEDLARFHANRLWQERYRAWKTTGKTDHEAHALSCMGQVAPV